MAWANTSRGKNGEIILQSTPSKPMQLLMELIREVIKKFQVDTNRIYITGLSMGGYGTFDALQRYPNFFAAAVPVCGSGDVSKAASIAHIPLWMFGGANDPSVNPTLLYDMVNALIKAGAHPGFTEYPNVGHFSWIPAYNDPMMMEWLFSQHK
jgi:predicted peptidase